MSDRTIYVHNFPPTITIEELRNIFSRFGSISDIHRDHNSVSIRYQDLSAAEEAIRTYDGSLLYGRIIRITRNVPETINPIVTLSTENSLLKESYETLIKQLYGIPVQLPQFLIINGLRVEFISFQRITEMLSQGQIERYILDPLLQPWADPPTSSNRILTMFGKNGITYLVKARYDLTTNQIFAPV